MIRIASKVTPALSRGNLNDSWNKVMPALSRQTLARTNFGKSCETPAPRPERTAPSVPIQTPRAQTAPAQSKPAAHNLPDMRVPRLEHKVLKGQKTALDLQGPPSSKVRISFGWNIRDQRCDVDASAFMVTSSGRVIADDWFVFYGQPVSPDGSLSLTDGVNDRKAFIWEPNRMNSQITKIVLVVSINEAFEQGLNFGMLKDAYVRITEDSTGRELVSFELQEYYNNVTSMTFGEIYLHSNRWKFNPVGNGVHMDLAGQCAVYGVEIG